MRIIRVLVALITVSVIILPQIALASAEVKDSNEIKIKFAIKNNLNIKNGVFISKYDLLSETPEDFEGYSREKSEEEIKREKALEKYAEKRKSANYPEGKFTINASAYTAAADECGKSDGITASGLKVRENETIACPPQFPLGTKIKIDGMGTYVCQDRGGAIKGNHIDIYMETKKEAFAFGRKNLVAEIVM